MTFSINLSNLNGSNGFRLDGKGERDFSGRVVSNAGDVNGDGFDDVIIGATGADLNGSGFYFHFGSSYVVFGKASGFSATMNLSSLDGSNGFRLNGMASHDQLGDSVSNAGDVNGDGFDDLIVGAPGVDSHGVNSGSSYVVFGKSSGFSATMNLSSLDGSNGFRLDGAATLDYSGSQVSNAGDVNGDGFADLIVGIRYSQKSSPATVDYVVFGKASGFSPVVNLSDLNGSNGFRLDLDTVHYAKSRSVSSAGDVNGDGYDDLIVGTYLAEGHYYAEYTIRADSYVIFGKATGFDTAVNLSNLDGSDGFHLAGAESNSYYRGIIAVSGAGDINGDGFDDVIIGAPEASRSGYASGSSYVVFGKASGFNANIDLSSLDGSNGFILDGSENPDGFSGEFFGVSVSTAGDVNGDGFDDLIVGAQYADSNGDRSGSSYVVFGKASGFSAAMNVSNLADGIGFRLDGVAAFDGSGNSVSTAGDVNNDGFDDLIVGASGADPNGNSSGSSYIIFGRSDLGRIPEILGTNGSDTLKGTTAAEHFIAGAGDDKLIGGGGEDIFDGDAGNDKIQIADLSFASVDGGVGTDVLYLAGTGLNLNLADFGDRINDIEIISLYSRDSNTLTLTATDLINLSTTTNILKVNGNTGGHVIVEGGGWIDSGSRGGGHYHEYTQGDAVLLVGQNLTVDFVA